MQKQTEAFARLLMIMDELRAKCPWDKKQTIESLRYLTIEETYELSDAIMENDLEKVKKELGDLLLHIVFYSKIGSEKNAFDITGVIDHICEKLIHRHPHIFADVVVKNAEEVKNNWEKIKLKEKGHDSVLGGVPSTLPALVKAYRIQEKARGVGFDWEHAGQVWDKVMEEMAEFRHEVENNGAENKKEEEFGDLLFALVNYARFCDINPEDALEKTNRKFIKRFSFIEDQVRGNGKSLKEMTLAELDEIWNKAKKIE